MYLLNLMAKAQGISPSQELQSLLSYTGSALEVQHIRLFSVPIEANQIQTFSLEGLARLRLLTIKATSAVQVSLLNQLVTATLTVDMPDLSDLTLNPLPTVPTDFTTTVQTHSWSAPALLHFYVFNPVLPEHFKIRNPGAEATTVEIAIAGGPTTGS